MVVDVINTTSKNLKRIKPKTINDIYKQKKYVVDFSLKMKKTDNQIKLFLKENMYNHKGVIANTNKGKKILNDLFRCLIKKPKNYIRKDLFKNEKSERVVADFIAGMTDRFAINLHKKLL